MIARPVLHSGYNIKDNISVNFRIDKVFFTEIYSLSNGKYFYLFTSVKIADVIDKGSKYDLVKLNVSGVDYVGVISDDNDNKRIDEIINNITTLKGFECVAGMEQLKKVLINDVIGPLSSPEKFNKFKVSIPNGILLFGPPGCGKTFIVRKLAEEINYNYMEVKHSDVASSYIHGSVGKISKIFEIAKLKSPSIIFIDEIEGLIPKRENINSSSQHKQEEVNEFLLQLNDASKNKVLVVGATNRPHLIDLAIMRSGRMDKRIYVSPPDFEARRDLFKIHLTGRPYNKDINFDLLANKTDNYVSSDIELIVTESAREAILNDKKEIDENMILSVINKTKPSISLSEIDYYEQFIDLERY